MNKPLIVLLLLLLVLNSCSGQRNDQNTTTKDQKAINTKDSSSMPERFDFKRYSTGESAVLTYTREDGTEVEMVGGDAPYIRETPPPPAFHIVYKRFYKDGMIKSRETRLGEYVVIGVSRYFDEQGQLAREVNEDAKFGAIKPTDVLLFLEKEGWINMKTGEGREKIELVFKESGETQGAEKKKAWYATVKDAGAVPAMPPVGKGEPPARYPLTYELDGETGAVLHKYDQP